MTDSLQQVLTEAKTTEDSISAFCQLGWNINWSDPESTFHFGTKALELSARIRNKERIAEAYDAAALGYWVKNDLKKARELYNKALSIGEKNNLQLRIAWGNYNLGSLSLGEKRYSEARTYAEKSKNVFASLGKTRWVLQSSRLLETINSMPDGGVLPLSLVDSLKEELSKAKNAEDSISIYCWMAWSSNWSDPDLTFRNGKKALELSYKVRNQEQLAEVYDAAALGYFVQKDFKKAKELYNKALRIGEEYNLPVRIAWENYNLADLSLRVQKYDDARRYARRSRDEFRNLNNMEMVIKNNWVLIKSSGRRDNVFIDDAIVDYMNAIGVTKDPNLLLSRYFDLISLYGLQENRNRSMLYAIKALEIAEEVKDQNAMLKAYYQIGNYLRDYQHNYEVALLYYQKILDICKGYGNEQGIAGVLVDIGSVYKKLGNDSLALALFTESLERSRKINHRASIANAYQKIGEIYQLNRNYKKALTYYTQCYQTGCDSCLPVTFHRVLVNTGEVYLAMKDHANAVKFFGKSLELANSANANYERSVSYAALADVHKSRRNFVSALQYYHSALKYASAANSLSLKKDITIKLSDAYSAQNDYKKAFEYLRASKSIADSLSKISEAENLSRLETKFEFQNLKTQKELDRVRADEEIKKQAEQKYILLIGFVLVTVLVMVVYLNFRRKKRDNAILEEQKVQIETMSEKVHEADQRKLNFFTNISHELRTPLTLILGPIERLIKENEGNLRGIQLLSLVRRNALHLYHLISQLLDIRKLDSGSTKLKVSESDIVGYCRGIHSTFSHIAEENAITFEFTSAHKQIIGWFDRDIVAKVLNNLLFNAFKYTDRGGSICLSVSPFSGAGTKASHVEIAVSDNGRGIPEDQIHYVFDRYYQVENTNAGFNTGTGIGLAYAKELVLLHKGEIRVESMPHHGTVFTLSLPIHSSYYSVMERMAANGEKDLNGNDSVEQKYLKEIVGAESVGTEKEGLLSRIVSEDSRIMLVVEDNPDLRLFVRNIFSDEYSIYEAPEGKAGYRIACEIIPDVIISDIMMPEMDGLELCRMLKGNAHTNHIPVLILTAKAGEENEIEGLRTGADDYLTKPFNAEVLDIRIKRLIESRRKLQEHFTREFLLNPSRAVASPDDEFLAKAVRIVEENIDNPGLNIELLMKELAVSRTQLFRKLKAITNYSANQFIRNIRLKRAAQLLQDTSYNITEVLYRTGFNSPSYFTACFRSMYGCAPKEYHSRFHNLPAGENTIIG